jgi:predicted DNA-binding protein YlxM (UPF0122 family)
MTLSKKQRQAIEWRRAKVQQYHSRNYSIQEIAQELKVSEQTISNDIRHWNDFIKKVDNEHIERINATAEKAIRQFEDLIKGAWKDHDNPKLDKDKQTAITTIKECNTYILEILAGKIDVTKLTRLSDIVAQKVKLDHNNNKSTVAEEEDNNKSNKQNEV